MTSGRQLLCLGAALLASAEAGWGQKASNWRVYKLADGLPESACLAATVSAQDKILVRHLNLPLMSELDGYTIVTRPAPFEIGKSRIYQSPGGQLWTAAPDGLREFKDGNWVLHPVPEIASRIHGSRVIDPVPLYAIKQGRVIFLLPDLLGEFNSENADRPQTSILRRATQTGLGIFSGICPAGDGGLWIVGQSGAAKIPGPLRNLLPETKWNEYLPPTALHIENLEAPHPLPRPERGDDSKPGFSALAECTTNHQKVLAYFDAQNWATEPLPTTKPRQAWIGPDNTRWTIAINSLFEWDEGARGELSESEEVSARQYFDMVMDFYGRFWLATSDGLFRYAPLPWRSPPGVRKLNSPVRCLAEDTDGRLWFVAGNRVHSLQNGLLKDFEFPSIANRSFQPRALYCLKGSVVLENDDLESNTNSQLFVLESGQNRFRPFAAPQSDRPLKALGLLSDGGLFFYHPNTNTSSTEAFFDRFDGEHFELSSIPLPPPALGRELRNLFAAQNGDLWLSGDSGTACYHDKKWLAYTSLDKSTPEAVIGFVELADGRIWCADEDQIWEFDGRNWTVLRRGFDRINALARTRDGSIWIACNNGLHRYYQGLWIENSVEEGLPSATVRELYEDARGLWAATTRGLALFHPHADRDPPVVNIEQLPELGNNSTETKTISLAFIGQDKWKYTPRERLHFSYRRDDREWSQYQESNHIALTDLPAGKHYLQVRAMDRSGNQSKQEQLDFAIVVPWYKETRLLLISSAGLAAALFFAALAFNRHHQLVRSYAEVEQKVAERTKQLEVANYELLQSQKMKALGTLAAGIAHDFNNILSIVKGSAQIIEDNLDNPAKIRTRADRIKTVVDQGAGIVKAMLGFSRDSGQEISLCDLNVVVEDTLKLLGDRFLREVQVKFLPAGELPPVMTSKEFIQQILLNFIFNASESMTNNRELIVSCRLMTKLPLELALLPVPASSYLAISVQDFGCGIPPQILPRIFEPFFTTKALSARRGTGLGLSMAYELAKKLGGGIFVESVVDHGSTFTLILPVRGQTEGTKAEAVSIATSTPL
jgi:signal transduction histidine kinase